MEPASLMNYSGGGLYSWIIKFDNLAELIPLHLEASSLC